MCDQLKISVIMPAYNAEKYIGSMMDSLLAQTMPDFELIVVDDGSRDGTLQLCQAAAGRDRRVVVVSQENSGPSAARNRGLEQARGTYVAFADADDLCEPRWLEKMLDALERHHCEMAMCGWVELRPGGEAACENFPRGARQIDPLQFVPMLRGLGASVWNKLFVRQILADHHIRFDRSKVLSEDFTFILEYLVHVQGIALVDEPLYRYRIVPESLTHSGDKGKLYWDICRGEYDALEKIKDAAPAPLYRSLSGFIIDTNIHSLIYTVRHKADGAYVKGLKQCLEEHRDGMSRKQKIYTGMIRVSPRLFERVWTALFELRRKRPGAR